MKLIDANNIDFVILEDSLHRIEHRKGDEIDCVIGAQEVKAIPLEVVEQIREEINSIETGGDCWELALKDEIMEIIDKALKEQNE